MFLIYAILCAAQGLVSLGYENLIEYWNFLKKFDKKDDLSYLFNIHMMRTN